MDDLDALLADLSAPPTAAQATPATTAGSAQPKQQMDELDSLMAELEAPAPKPTIQPQRQQPAPQRQQPAPQRQQP
eukprot:CAMPEP_0119133122 /NCGR_PEP_ID=MMETSP1310-20130426/13005_1 /TAXON_ID=464262 /ORGANISM="Genus nov. species nov., Strain RCC2339" /LENGTH=75 /DNA_ID=CAMNT_0007123799 /DNA_START=48 /DNA_END=272 /DNA_ORIENTATION=-